MSAKVRPPSAVNSGQPYSTWNTNNPAPGGTPAPAQILNIPLTNIFRWPGNPRTDFDEEKLIELAESLKTEGLLSPVVVRPTIGRDDVEGACYQIVAGERRWRAAHIAGLDALPCVVRDVDDLGALKIAIIENDQRDDVNPVERARGYARLVEAGMSQGQIAENVKKSQPFIASCVKLLKLPETVQTQISSRTLSASHAEVLFKYSDDPGVLAIMAETIAAQKIPVRELEKSLPHPITEALKNKKLVQTVDNYGESFDAKVCNACPYNAMRRDSYGVRVCFRPSHYNELTKAGREKEKAEQEAALAKAKAESGSGQITTKISDLKYNEYTTLSDERNAPEGCSPGCPCRCLALGRDKMPVTICRDPKRLEGLREAQDKKAHKARVDEGQKRLATLKEFARELAVEDAAPVLAVHVLARMDTIVDAQKKDLIGIWGFTWNLNAVFGYNGTATARHAALRDLCGLGMQTLLRYLITLPVAQELESWVNYPGSSYKLRFTEWLETVQVFGAKADPAEMEGMKPEPAGRLIVTARQIPDEDEDSDAEDDEEAEHCARCKCLIPPDLLGEAVENTNVFTNADGDERRHETLENGILVIDDEFFYCATCAPDVRMCKGCGCTDENGCAEGCAWVSADEDMCTVCAEAVMSAETGDSSVFEAPACRVCQERVALVGGLCHQCLQRDGAQLMEKVWAL